MLPEVRLVADHFVRRVVDALAADLNARVCVLTLQHELQTEFEVAVLVGCCQEIVVRDFLFQGAANDGSVLDAEDLKVAFPASEGRTVKQLPDFGWLGLWRCGFLRIGLDSLGVARLFGIVGDYL